MLPDGHPYPHAPCQEDAEALPSPPQRHLSLRRVLWGECASHGRCGRGVETSCHDMSCKGGHNAHIAEVLKHHVMTCHVKVVIMLMVTGQDPSIVKWLLDIGADFHRRCYGDFIFFVNFIKWFFTRDQLFKFLNWVCMYTSDELC